MAYYSDYELSLKCNVHAMGGLLDGISIDNIFEAAEINGARDRYETYVYQYEGDDFLNGLRDWLEGQDNRNYPRLKRAFDSLFTNDF